MRTKENKKKNREMLPFQSGAGQPKGKSLVERGLSVVLSLLIFCDLKREDKGTRAQSLPDRDS